MTKDRLTQDNEPLTFIQLGLAAALVVNRMRNAQALRELVNSDEKQDKDANRDRKPTQTDEKRAEDERRYIDTRLREIAAWERKIRNGKM